MRTVDHINQLNVIVTHVISHSLYDRLTSHLFIHSLLKLFIHTFYRPTTVTYSQRKEIRTGNRQKIGAAL